MSEYKSGVGSWDQDESPNKNEPVTIGEGTIMWFGRHKGKSFAQVPADYFLWLYDQANVDPKIRAYVEANLDSLKQEADIKKWNL